MAQTTHKIKKFFFWLIKQKFFPYILVIILSIPAFSFFFKPGIYWNMHDDMQMVRQLEFEKCLFDGQIPCRWTPDLGFGYGYPLFNFYPPLPSIIGQIFRTLQFNFVTTVKLTAVVQFILAACFMYLLVSSIFGPLGGIFSALFYTYAPYHALNIYVRGAMNEAWASVFFPLAFYYSRKLILEKKPKFIIGLGISFLCLLLSHNPMVLIFTPILVIWSAFWLITKFQKKLSIWQNIKKQFSVFLKLCLSAIIAFGLAAFFTIPTLIETKYVSIETMFNGYYHFSAHFVSLYQMFISNFWGDGGSIWGPNDSMSFMIGYLHWIVPILIIIVSLIQFFKTKKINSKILLSSIFIFIGFLTAFMCHERSTPIWFIFPIIQKVQFPWRFLNLTTFVFSLSIGVLPLILNKFLKLKNQFSYLIIGLISIVLFSLNIKYFSPVHSGPITDEQKFSGLNWERQITSGIYDYLPKTAAKAAISPAKEYIDEVNPKDSLINISEQQKGTDWLFFTLSLNQAAQITISQLAFPNFQITDNNQKIDYQIDPEFGRMVINLSAGKHQIFIKLHNTPVRIISNYISLVTLLIVATYLLKPLWNRSTSRK